MTYREDVDAAKYRCKNFRRLLSGMAAIKNESDRHFLQAELCRNHVRDLNLAHSVRLTKKQVAEIFDS